MLAELFASFQRLSLLLVPLRLRWFGFFSFFQLLKLRGLGLSFLLGKLFDH